MALDFALITENGEQLRCLAIGISLHALLFYSIDQKEFPLLHRFHDYYVDARIEPHEISNFRTELQKIKDINISNGKAINFIENLFEMVSFAELNNLPILSIAD